MQQARWLVPLDATQPIAQSVHSCVLEERDRWVPAATRILVCVQGPERFLAARHLTNLHAAIASYIMRSPCLQASWTECGAGTTPPCSSLRLPRWGARRALWGGGRKQLKRTQGGAEVRTASRRLGGRTSKQSTKQQGHR